VSCDIEQWWTGTDYNSCSDCGSCSYGCVRPENCNLCEDELCEECTSFEADCATCKEHSAKQSGICKCNTGYFQDNDKCSECTRNCNRWFLDECLECNFGYSLFEGGCIFCAEGTYFESGSCLSCDPSCDGCSGSESSNCDLCNFAENFEDDGSGNCVCKAGLFRDGAVCSPCSSNCAQCSGSPSQCTACTSPLVLDSSTNRCSCKKGFTQINNTCECTDGVIREGVCTNFYSNLTCDKDNLLTLTFSEPVASSLTQESITSSYKTKALSTLTHFNR